MLLLWWTFMSGSIEVSTTALWMAINLSLHTEMSCVFFYFSFLIIIKSYVQLLPYSQGVSTALHAGFGRFLWSMPFLMQTLKIFVFPTRTGLGSFSLLDKCANHNTINNLNYS